MQNLPLSLDGVSVNIGGKPAALFYLSPTQLNVQAPAALAPGAVTAEVLRDGLSSLPALGELRSTAPALFTYPAAGRLNAAAVFPTHPRRRRASRRKGGRGHDWPAHL